MPCANPPFLAILLIGVVGAVWLLQFLQAFVLVALHGEAFGLSGELVYRVHLFGELVFWVHGSSFITVGQSPIIIVKSCCRGSRRKDIVFASQARPLLAKG